MPVIRKLSEELIAKIAAGEVIERPASVVKELVENAIDAGAREIIVEVDDGGRRGIVVLDDGCGMGRDDAALALERHATSKLADEAGLFQISTLGFRGEALPSIAAVSRMTLESKRAEDEVAVLLEVEGGRIVRRGVSSLARGTRIAVNNLFFNTPARLKFLKSRETEFSHIAGWLESMALGRPEIGFQLAHNGKREIDCRSEADCRPQSSVRRRIQDLFGTEVSGALRPVSSSRGPIELTGFVSDNRLTFGSAGSIYLFVNGRSVRDRLLRHALLQAYESLLMKNRYPFTVLYLSVPTDFVDVNVHPTKNEVRFAQPNLVHDLVREAVKEALREEGNLPSGTNGSSDPVPPVAPLRHSRAGNPSAAGRPVEQASLRGLPRPLEALGPAPSRQGSLDPSLPSGNIPSSLEGLPLRVLGQVHGTYLICESQDKLILIDQHAAHERIGLEKLKHQYESGGVQRQMMLIPQSFELRPSHAEILRQYLPELAKVGLDVEDFGGNGFLLRSVPALLGETDPLPLINDLVESLQAHGSLAPLEARIHEILETIACHRQVRAGDTLSTPEIEALLKEMETTDFSHSCAHGRPTKVEIPFTDVEKWFKRRG